MGDQGWAGAELYLGTSPSQPRRVGITFGLLTAAVLALWVPVPRTWRVGRRAAVWVVPLAAALVAAWVAGLLTPVALVSMGALFGFAVLATRDPAPLWQTWVGSLGLLAVAAGLMLHRWPGFQNPQVLSSLLLRPDAAPFSLHLNLDKTLIGLAVLGLCHPRINGGWEWRLVLRLALPWAALLIGVLMVVSIRIGFVRWDPAWPAATPLFLWVNLCFTCFAEEALFRGFLQARLSDALAGVAQGQWLAWVVSSLAFGAAHAAGGATYVGLATLAGLGYGWIYRKTRRVEASILAHFLLNAVHFLGFTYPVLAGR